MSAPAPAPRTHIADIAILGDIAEVADVLVVLEDFLLHADADTLEDLAGYRPARPEDWSVPAFLDTRIKLPSR